MKGFEMKNLEINLNAKVGKQRMFLLAVLDVLSVVAAYFLALMLRFDFKYSHILADKGNYIEGFLTSIPLWCAVTVSVFFYWRLYHSIWRQASVAELEMIILAYAVLVPCY